LREHEWYGMVVVVVYVKTKGSVVLNMNMKSYCYLTPTGRVSLLYYSAGNGFFTGNWIGIELTLLLESRSRIWLGLVGLVIWWWMHVKGIT
jgi:hypothetical protein